jgi:hypothetical protein
MNPRSFGFTFRDSLLSGTASRQGIYLFYKDKEYESIQSFMTDIKPTEDESKFLTETTQKLIK